jgi:hypothetical protein
VIDTLIDVPDEDVIALGQIILGRTRLSLPCMTRKQAIAIIYGLRPASPKVKAQQPLTLCTRCGRSIKHGEPVNMSGEHISCPLFSAAMLSIN